MTTLTIGQLAKSANVGVETVRFYERKALLAEPDRRPSGYRQYDEEVVDRLRFIKRAKELGVSLSQPTGGARKKVDILADIEKIEQSNVDGSDDSPVE